jgi:tRNA-dihydrouridine synthase C
MKPFSNRKIDFAQPRIFLAPMEGVVDAVLRELISLEGGVDACVTEFIRVTSTLHGNDVFYRYCPELHTDSRTRNGTPVLVQLLGSDTNAMAENAARAAELGAFGIDLNFGCPAKTVNNHDGGAALLKTPDRVHNIVDAVRKAVPSQITVSAKMRLGFDSKDYVTDIALGAESAGSEWICIHARTKLDGYKPPAYWEYIAPLKDKIKIPIIANGEVWTKEHHTNCVERSLTPHVMIGRGLVANPGLASEIKFRSTKLPWLYWKNFIFQFLEKSKIHRHEKYAVQRVKQLTKMMGQTYGESLLLHEKIKRLLDYQDVFAEIKAHFSDTEGFKDIPEAKLIVPKSIPSIAQHCHP